MCNYAVTAPLQKEQASMVLSASTCKILTFLQDENIHRRLIEQATGSIRVAVNLVFFL